MTRRKMYKEQRYSVFLGLQVTPEMNAELEREAERALHPKSEFIRHMIEEGLKTWRLRQPRLAQDGP